MNNLKIFFLKYKIFKHFYLRLHYFKNVIRFLYQLIRYSNKRWLLFFLKIEVLKMLLGEKITTQYRQYKLLKRYESKIITTSTSIEIKTLGLNSCNINYINLINRNDRKTQIEIEFEKISITNYRRVDAIKMNMG
jgi:hypothetical protein